MRPVRAVALGFSLLVCAWSAFAQPARTFVASTGNDANVPCALSAPCRSLQVGFNNVATGGEVVVLDSAGYGIITIDRSVSIQVPPGIYGGVTPGPGATGVMVTTVNSTDFVVLRGLTINGLGAANRGIDFLASGTLYVDSCVIIGLTNIGILLRPNSLNQPASINNTIVRNCGTAGIGLGTSHAAIDGCRIESCLNGLYDTANAGHTMIRNSSLNANTNGIQIDLFNSTGADTTIEVENCIITHNNVGIITAGNNSAGSAIVNVSNTYLAFNAQALQAGAGGQIKTFGNNKLADNPTPGVFTGSISQQ